MPLDYFWIAVLVKASEGACVGGWQSNFGYEYCADSNTVSHSSARTTCQGMNAELASITSAAECDYLDGLMSVNFLWIDLIRPPGTVVPDGLLFYPWCFSFFFLDSHISEVSQPIAAKLFHTIEIWLESPNKDGKFRGPPQKNFRGQNMQNFGRFFATSDYDREYLRNGLRHPNRHRSIPPAF